MLQRKKDAGFSGLRKRTLVKRREMLAGLGAALLLSISRVMPAKALMPADAITATEPRTWAAAPREQPVFVQKGKASWYGPRIGRRRMASGDWFDHRKMTAAHKKLPLGACVRVVDVASGGSVDVTINDRGPHRCGRIIDLSPAAAYRLDIMDSGLAEVRIEVYAGAQPTDEIREAVLDIASAAPPQGGVAPARRRRQRDAGVGVES